MDVTREGEELEIHGKTRVSMQYAPLRFAFGGLRVDSQSRESSLHRCGAATEGRTCADLDKQKSSILLYPLSFFLHKALP